MNASSALSETVRAPTWVTHQGRWCCAITSRGTRWPWRFSMSRKCASVPALTKLTASPAAPARAVRPMRCVWSTAERGRS